MDKGINSHFANHQIFSHRHVWGSLIPSTPPQQNVTDISVKVQKYIKSKYTRFNMNGGGGGGGGGGL